MSSAFGAMAGLPGSCPTIPTSVVSHSASARAADGLLSGLGDLALGRKGAGATASVSGGADRGRPHGAGIPWPAPPGGARPLCPGARCTVLRRSWLTQPSPPDGAGGPAKSRDSRKSPFAQFPLRPLLHTDWPFPLPPPTTAQ